MTALNCFVTREAVHIVTDGAGYRTDGTAFGRNQKLSILAHLPAVIAIRGPVALVHILGAAVAASFATFDETVEAAPDLFRATLAGYIEDMERRDLGAEVPREADFVIAGHSLARDRLEAYGLSSAAQNSLSPWSLYAIPSDSISPIDERVMKAIDVIAADVGAPGDAPEEWAARLVEAQRACPFDVAGRSVVAVGGFCQCTTLTRDGVSTRILRRWPSEVGERLNLAIGVAAPSISASGPSA